MKLFLLKNGKISIQSENVKYKSSLNNKNNKIIQNQYILFKQNEKILFEDYPYYLTFKIQENRK